MADNTPKLIGNRLRLIDPNDFENQSQGGMFGDSNYNMSVPLEDLSIIVELKTSSKSRTILTTENNKNTRITQNTGNNIVVNFIKGTDDSSTGNQNYLTTEYTEVSSGLDALEETLGISDIQIDFSSSYAPMININFIDMRGASIFQPDGDSPFNVFFKLPYPIFELKIKGYYGKPVTYCLHMLKCNTKFNSQSGNFEISANFIGYTYAMLSDMIIGYLKAAGETARGKELLKQRGVPSINVFLKEIANIDELIKKSLLKDDDEDVSNLSKIKNLIEIVNSIKTLLTSTIQHLNLLGLYKVIESSDEDIVIVQGLDPTQPINDTENLKIINQFLTDVNKLKTDFDSKASGISDINYTNGAALFMFTTKVGTLYYGDDTVKKASLYSNISNVYSIDSKNVNLIEAIVTRFKTAAGKLSPLDPNNNIDVRFYDFTDINGKDVDEKIKALNTRESDLSKAIALKLKDLISKKLGFDSTIRNVVNIFTTHIEIFLQILFEVSSDYKNPLRTAELKPWLNNTDIKVVEKPEDQVIYPWPEYHENNVERYLGSKKGPLKNPLNVPEIKFVEEMLQGMIISQSVIEDVNKVLVEGTTSWYSVNPIDSLLFNNTEKSPYDRLGTNPQPVDIARLVVLRATGFMGFSNAFDSLSKDEIEAFATQEANSVVSKYKNTANIIQALKLNYQSSDSYANITGQINFKDTKVLSDNGDYWKYNYIDYSTYGPDPSGNREILPLTGNFKDKTGSVNGYDNYEDTANVKYKLSNLNSRIEANPNKDSSIFLRPDSANYIDFVSATSYKNTNLTSPSGQKPTPFNFESLKTKIESKDRLTSQLKSSGFLANAGIYGVQEFSEIVYQDGNTYDFYSIFYNNGNTYFNEDSKIASSLARPRFYGTTNNQPFSTKWDLPSTVNGVINIPLITEYPDINSLQAIYKPKNTKSNPNARVDVGNNIGLFLEQTRKHNESSVSFPFLNFSVQVKASTRAPYQPDVQVSLFGSRFYNAQNINGRTFLFLHSLPWNGLICADEKNGSIGIFNQTEILNIFQYRTGFVQVPKLFPAFIGGLLWRMAQPSDPIHWYGTDNQVYIPTFGSYNNNVPKQDEYLKASNGNPLSSAMSFSREKFTEYAKVEDVIKNLPKSVKDKFIAEFNSFVQEFDNKRKDFELKLITQTSIDGSWKDTFNNIVAGTTFDTTKNIATTNISNIQNKIKLSNDRSLSDTFNVFSYFCEQNNGIISSSDDNIKDNFKYNYFLEYRDDSNAVSIFKNWLFDLKYISNESWLIWSSDYSNSTLNHTPIVISKSNFKIYIDAFNLKLKDFVDTTEKKKFGGNDLEEIKFEIYRTLKKLYDKWIGATATKDKILFQCCTVKPTTLTPDRLSGDTQLNIHRGGDGRSPALIDSFRFITRSFRDIGDEFQINPLIISKLLLESTDISFSDLISRVLTENHFDFISLPSFVDYNDEKELKSIFKPYPYYEAAKLTTVGPSFVCVYVGQTSSKLDFGSKSEYPNDGFDLTSDSNNWPSDFKGVKQNWEDVGAAFVVRYGQQNQNIFKDISLDQSEFGETAESLQITDKIANSFSQTSQTYVGQNLYNVYSIRSYKVEVEMLGDAMIQPMMYFQLENIPMFHGAYLITRVKHSIKPNYMTTVFTGTRIKINETPLLDAAALYSGILQGYNLPDAGTASLTSNVGGYSNYVNAYYDILSNNIPADKTIVRDASSLNDNTVFNTSSTELGKWNNGTLKETDPNGVVYIQTYFAGPYNNKSKGLGYFTNKDPWSAAFISYIMNSADKSFPASAIHKDYITNAMNGEFGYEVFPLKAGLKIRAQIGDILTLPRSGGYTLSHSNLIYKIENNIAYLIGGNRSQAGGTAEGVTVRVSTLQLDAQGYITDSTDVSEYKLLMKRTQGKYYGGKKLANTTTVTSTSTKTKSTKVSADMANNQKIVKNFLKTYFTQMFNNDTLAKIYTASVMGNIQLESGFNPTVSILDTNNKISYGLIQWNSGSYSNIETTVGSTAQSQIENVVGAFTPRFKTFLKNAKNEGNLDAYTGAFIFAKSVEGCANCTSSIDAYNADTKYFQYKRSQYANDFINRFNTEGDLLKW